MTEEGYIPFLDGKTYYRIVGKEYQKTPLLVLHGGPGSTHNSYELLDDFAQLDQRPLVMYDQYGCGKSYHPGKHEGAYRKETWVRELQNLREKLHLEKIHLMGHSWGGMLSIIYLTDYAPKGVMSVTLSSTLSSASLWDKETHRLIRYLPLADQKAIQEAETKNDYSIEAFQKANEDYLRMTVSDYDKSDPTIPECLRREKQGGKEAYLEAWGPSEFRPLGNLKDYEYTEKLERITAPVLLISGTDDESTPLQNKVMFSHLVGSKERRWKLLSPARHMTYYEKKDEYEKELKNFLDHTEEK